MFVSLKTCSKKACFPHSSFQVNFMSSPCLVLFLNRKLTLWNISQVSVPDLTPSKLIFQTMLKPPYAPLLCILCFKAFWFLWWNRMKQHYALELWGFFIYWCFGIWGTGKMCFPWYTAEYTKLFESVFARWSNKTGTSFTIWNVKNCSPLA